MDDDQRVVRRAVGPGLTFEELADFVDECRARIDQGFEPGVVIAREQFRSGVTEIEMTLSRSEALGEDQ